MALNDELKEMLARLQQEAEKRSADTGNIPKAVQNRSYNKNIDAMSVDDLINAVSAERKSLTPVISESPAETGADSAFSDSYDLNLTANPIPAVTTPEKSEFHNVITPEVPQQSEQTIKHTSDVNEKPEQRTDEDEKAAEEVKTKKSGKTKKRPSVKRIKKQNVIKYDLPPETVEEILPPVEYEQIKSEPAVGPIEPETIAEPEQAESEPIEPEPIDEPEQQPEPQPEPVTDSKAETDEEPLEDAADDKEYNVSETEGTESDEINIDIDAGENKVRKKSRLVSALEKILGETPENLSDTRQNPEEDTDIDVSVKRSGRLKKSLYFVSGILFFIFAVIGLTFTVAKGLDYLRELNSTESGEFGGEFIKTVTPAVIMDIETFQSPSELTSQQVITASIWKLVTSGEDMDKYLKTKVFDIITVPAIDIEKYASKVFGQTVSIDEHQTVGSGEVKFYYNEETKSYNIPVKPMMFSYRPRISAVSENNGVYTVEVEYVRELPAWMIPETENGEVAKVAQYKLEMNGDEYIIIAVEIISVNKMS